MDNNSADHQLQSNSPTIPQQQTPVRSKGPLLIVAMVLLMAGFGGGGFFLGKYLNTGPDRGSSIVNDRVLPEKWTKLDSNKKGFPITGKDPSVLSYYSLDKAKAITVNSIKFTETGGASSGLGAADPIASPDLYYIAYIGADNNLYLFSNETEQTQQLTKNGFVTFISGWSPDSKKILFYFGHRTIADVSYPLDAPAPDSATFRPQSELGFYQINIETGEVTPFAATEDIEGYINNDTLLVKADYESHQLVTFNLKTFVADLGLIDLDAGFGVGQYSFSSDGKLWAYSAAENIDAPTKGKVPIVFGEFPKTATTVVDTGTWAEVQKPMFSPDNNKIAYQKRVGYSGNVPQDQIWIYDIASGQKSGIGDGDPVRWIDGKTLLIRVYDNPEDIHARLALINIETKQITPVSE